MKWKRFRVTGPLWGISTGPRWVTPTNGAFDVFCQPEHAGDLLEIPHSYDARDVTEMKRVKHNFTTKYVGNSVLATASLGLW